VFKAEVNMRVRGKHFRATSEKDDLYSAIDDMRTNSYANFLLTRKKRAPSFVRVQE